ncbi:hypothetical protein PQZ67_gp47 [Escherichia phage ZCEC13]|nr:hypothetical protein PQZ67_gp47 [Escherichia phage ZCEC13]
MHAWLHIPATRWCEGIGHPGPLRHMCYMPVNK